MNTEIEQTFENLMDDAIVDLLMSNPWGYAEMSKIKMENFLIQFAQQNEFNITEDNIAQLTKDIFNAMKKSYIKLDTARDYYALARHKNDSFTNFVAQNNKC